MFYILYIVLYNILYNKSCVIHFVVIHREVTKYFCLGVEEGGAVTLILKVYVYTHTTNPKGVNVNFKIVV